MFIFISAGVKWIVGAHVQILARNGKGKLAASTLGSELLVLRRVIDLPPYS